MSWLSWLVVVLSAVFVLVVLPSFGPVRNVLAWPLVVDDPHASGDAAYLLAGGDSFRERLSAGVRLYHAGRVPLLLLQRDDRVGPSDATTGRPLSATEWALAYLEWRGVPRDHVVVLDPPSAAPLGTLAEARNVAARLPNGVRRLVIVTSAAHTRRARLAFRRSLPSGVTLAVSSASPFAVSLEMYRPLWIEYAKLLVYAVVA